MILRRTFVVHVQVVDGVAVVENPRTNELTRVEDLALIGAQIGRWLDAESVTRTPPEAGSTPRGRAQAR